MKGIYLENRRLLKLFLIIITLLFLSACDGVTPSGPTISSFIASSTSITEGESVTLSWITTEATNVYLGQVSESSGSTGTVDPSGSKIVSPSETTTYTLTANDGSGSDSSSITITVSADTTGFPTIDSFTATTTLIEAGEHVTLNWVTTGATTVSLEHSSLSSAGGEEVDPTGSKTVSPDEDTEYILTAINSAGSTTETVTITIKLPVLNFFTEVYYPTIQAAIDDAEEDMTHGVFILVSPGIYYENIVFREDFTIHLASDGGDPAGCIIDGSGLDSVVTVIDGGKAIMQGFTIQNGRAYFGGGIHIVDSGASIRDCIVLENEAVNSGGGVYVYNGYVEISMNSIIQDNDANGHGGGICIERSSVTIDDSLIIGNDTGLKGGGIHIRNISGSDTVTIKSNTIRENRADSSEDEAGGGVYINKDTVDRLLVQIGSHLESEYSWYNTICSNEPDQFIPLNWIGWNFTNFNYVDNVCR